MPYQQMTEIDHLGTVLIIDDELTVATVYTQALRRVGIPAEFRLCARDAQERIENNGIALILVDLLMPYDDGRKLINWITTHHPDMSIVILTGVSPTERENLAYPVIEKGESLHVAVDRIVLYLRLQAYRKGLLKIRKDVEDGLARLDVRLVSYTMANMIKEFFDNALGKSLLAVCGAFLTVVLCVLGWGANELKAMSNEQSEQKAIVRSSVATQDAMRQEVLLLLRRIDSREHHSSDRVEEVPRK